MASVRFVEWCHMNSEDFRGAWDEFYSEEQGLGVQARNLGEHDALFDEIGRTKPHSVLEVGVGNGGMTLFLGSVGIRAVGVDNNLAILERARARSRAVPTVHFEPADAFRLSDSYATGSFDVAFSQGFFEHFDDDQIRKLVVQQLAVARRVVFSVPSDEYPQQDFGNERLMSPQRWEAILAPVGCAQARYYGVHVLPLRVAVARKLKGKRTQLRNHVLVSIEPRAAAAE